MRITIQCDISANKVNKTVKRREKKRRGGKKRKAKQKTTTIYIDVPTPIDTRGMCLLPVLFANVINKLKILL